MILLVVCLLLLAVLAALGFSLARFSMTGKRQTLEEARRYANADGTELSMVFQFEHVGLDASPADKWSTARVPLPALKKNLAKWQTGLEGQAWNSLFFCNHDQPRVVSRWGDGSPQAAKCLATALHMM